MSLTSKRHLQAVSREYPVEMLTVVVRDHWTLPYECDEPENFAGGEGTSVCSCYAFSKEDLAWLVGQGPKPKYKWEAAARADRAAARADREAARAGKILFVAPRPGQKALLDNKESGYHGNQFDEGGEILSVYFEAALVVDLKNKGEKWSRSGGRLRSLA